MLLLQTSFKRSLKELSTIPFDMSELIRLDKVYLRQPKSTDDFDRSSVCSGATTPDEGTEEFAKERRNPRKRSQAEVQDTEQLMQSALDANAAAKKAANISSMSRIGHYPRLRVSAINFRISSCLDVFCVLFGQGLMEKLKAQKQHVELLCVLRQLRHLEEYRWPDDDGRYESRQQKELPLEMISVRHTAVANPITTASNRSLLPFEVETMLLKVFWEARGTDLDSTSSTF